jgi:hypothetical protein
MEDLTLASSPATAASATPAGWGGGHSSAWKEGDFSFRDLLDTINPLQHIPVISTLYRAITGDEQIGNIPRLVGDALFGGPIGLFTGVIGVAVKEETGRDLGEHALALIDDSLVPGTTAVAAKDGKDAAPAAAQAAASPGETTVALTSPPQADSATPPQTAAPPAAAAVAPPQAAPSTAPSTAPSAAPVVPDHPPMPLVPAARPAAVASTAAAATKGPEGEFAAQYAALQRRIGAAGGHGTATAPIPLQTGAFPTMAGRFRASPYATAPAQALPQNAPVDISQQMMSALDKYARIHRSGGEAAPGSAVDLVQ